MWREMARIIHEVRPRFVFVENSLMLTSRGLGRVLGDLASMGFNARWGVLGAADVSAPHQRDRIWIRANLPNSNSINDALRGDSQDYEKSMGIRGNESRRSFGNSGPGCQEGTGQSQSVAHSGEVRLCSPQAEQRMEGGIGLAKRSMDGNWWAREPGETPRTTERGLGRVADGVASRVDRLKAIGNGQVSEVARRAWEVLSDKR
jgi:DNA (cytosine-5)-methyltransferase 1